MKLECNFKSIDYSQSLVDYTDEKLTKLEKFELKSEKIQVTYASSRHQKSVEFCIQHHHEFIRATAKCEDYYSAVDKAVEKMKNQLNKRKKKVQNHKRFGHSKGGKILQLNEALEMDHKQYHRKAG